MAIAINGNGTITGLSAGGLPDDSVNLADLSATGTASSSTFLRGDNSWAAAGKVVKHAYQTYDTQANTSSSSYTDTGLTIDFSPTASSNIVYIICMQQCYINSSGSNGDARSQFQLQAGGTALATTQFEGSSGNSNSENAGVETLVGKFVAASTSAVTIKTQYRAVTGDAYAQHGGRESNLLIIEVEP